jgi:hypothetical protein
VRVLILGFGEGIVSYGAEEECTRHAIGAFTQEDLAKQGYCTKGFI